mgnify:CR=1
MRLPITVGRRICLENETPAFRPECGCFSSCPPLFCVNSFAGANAGAGTAVDALLGVDYIDIACRNSLNGAFVDAGAACDARV